ncbi:hypothetical protein NKR23_g6504 [Pleurostoma richardsiae]|uniref:SnoaL-like domain-containing protein n=1 Tax=Pleurostoma richardsiae TaxID=41990 RepID=A0AA38RCI8_9PEZI|nr:hypothetical protein NKR23_g6504 [Pleurostoma richardsiae]
MSQFSPLTTTEVEALFTAIFSGPDEALIPTVQKWFSPDYVQVTDGHSSNIDEFVAHLNKLRSLVSKISVKVVFLVQEDRKVADRHIVTLEKVDGSTAVMEVLLLGERDETGKFLRVWETVRTTEGDKASAELARVR